MTKVQKLRAKIDKHNAYSNRKFAEYKKMNELEVKTFIRLRRLTLHENLLLDLKIQFADAWMKCR